MKENPLIIALNFTDEARSLTIVERLRPYVDRFKIGLPLFTRYGSLIVRKVLEYETRVFLDLKLHDIPSVVAQTIESLSELNIEFLTLHLQGGLNMATLAMKKTTNIKLLGVTVLTSISSLEFKTIYNSDLKRSVIKLAGIASKAGLFGVVSSGYESEEIKKLYPELKTVVPGIRLSRNSDDQARVLTPAEALKKRADYIVVGRDITHSPDPESKIKLYLEEIEKCR